MAYRSFCGGSGRLDTHLDTPPSINRRHPVSCLAPRRGGRQSGAISKEWREILKRVAVAYPNGAMPEDIAAFGPIVGLDNLRPRDARQQAEKYVGHGYLEHIGDRYRVTAKAQERFGFSGEAALPSFFQPSAEETADDDPA